MLDLFAYLIVLIICLPIILLILIGSGGVLLVLFSPLIALFMRGVEDEETK